ncbi:MAG TPA: tetratricopeptide repeat protein [Candidatus Binatia bacterium]|nr:tetratricopeptide repeat protein [Candidatus Binatia bacterium]
MRAETRHQLKTDAFSRVTIDAAERTAHWTVEHRNTLIAAAIAAVVLLALAIGGWYYLNTQDEKASFDMSQAVRTLDAQIVPPGTPAQPDSTTFTSVKERADAAHKQFQAIIDHYPHTRTADMARYFLGVSSADAGDNAAAETAYKSVAGSGGKDLSSVAKLALATLYGNTGRTKDAVAAYQDLINHPTAAVSKVTAELQLAELYQNTNQPLDAKRLYEQIKKENPGPEAVQLANQKLSQLK